MKIETKFKIGEEVYIIEEGIKGVLEIYKDVIGSIFINDDLSVSYYIDSVTNTFDENEIFKLNDRKGIIKTIENYFHVEEVEDEKTDSKED